MKFSIDAFLLLTLLFLTSTSISYCQSRIPESVNAPHSCCTKYIQRVIPRKQVVGYRKTLNCNLPAIIFTNKRGQEICANPNIKWVQDYLKDPNIPVLPPKGLNQNKKAPSKQN